MRLSPAVRECISWALCGAAFYALALTLTGCGSLSQPPPVPMVQTSNVDLAPLVEYHDEGVGLDATLEQDARELALAQSRLLLESMEAADKMPQGQFRTLVGPVVERYDLYLDQAFLAGRLTLFEQRYLGRSSDLARMIAGMLPHRRAWAQ